MVQQRYPASNLSIWSFSSCRVSKSTWISSKTQSAESTNFQLSKTSKIFEIGHMVMENGWFEDHSLDSVWLSQNPRGSSEDEKIEKYELSAVRNTKHHRNRACGHGKRFIQSRPGPDLRSHLFFIKKKMSSLTILNPFNKPCYFW